MKSDLIDRIVTASDRERYRNPGTETFNGVAMMADLTGLSQAEIRWTAMRMKQLYSEGKMKKEVLSIVRSEGRSKPWTVV